MDSHRTDWYGTREITCLTATTLFGEILWQTGKPSRENGRIYSNLPVQVYGWDADGRIAETFPMAYAPGVAPADRPDAFYALVADVWGDGRDEVILFKGRGLCIYANARPAAIPTLYNETLYPGM